MISQLLDSVFSGPLLVLIASVSASALITIMLCHKNVRLREILWCALFGFMCEAGRDVSIIINAYHRNFSTESHSFRTAVGACALATVIVTAARFKYVIEVMCCPAHEPTSEQDQRFAEAAEFKSNNITAITQRGRRQAEERLASLVETR